LGVWKVLILGGVIGGLLFALGFFEGGKIDIFFTQKKPFCRLSFLLKPATFVISL
jgi:hypothetical protein